MKNVALIVVPETIGEQQVVNKAPAAAAEVSWHGSMLVPTDGPEPVPIMSGGSVRVPGSIPYRGSFGPLIGSQIIMLRFKADYDVERIQTWLDRFGVSPVILVALWRGDWMRRIVDGVPVRRLRSWRVRNGLLAQYTAAQIKNQLREFFPLTEAGAEPVLLRLAHWQGGAYPAFDADEGWLDDREQEE